MNHIRRCVLGKILQFQKLWCALCFIHLHSPSFTSFTSLVSFTTFAPFASLASFTSFIFYTFFPHLPPHLFVTFSSFTFTCTPLSLLPFTPSPYTLLSPLHPSSPHPLPLHSFTLSPFTSVSFHSLQLLIFPAVNPYHVEFGWASNNTIFATLRMDYTAH